MGQRCRIVGLARMASRSSKMNGPFRLLWKANTPAQVRMMAGISDDPTGATATTLFGAGVAWARGSAAARRARRSCRRPRALCAMPACGPLARLDSAPDGTKSATAATSDRPRALGREGSSFPRSAVWLDANPHGHGMRGAGREPTAADAAVLIPGGRPRAADGGEAQEAR